ncbi:MAG: chromate transporter [Massiliimalia sp.]|jgi:chromate transporter
MTYLLLFVEFFKTGLFAIGGGLATLPFLYDLADKYPWFDRSMLADMIAVSESTPGPIGVNMATYAGFHAGGILGGIIATVGLVTPSVIVIVIVAKFLQKFSDNKYVNHAFYGLRPVVTALIAAACFEILKITVFTFDTFLSTNQILDLINWKNTVLFAVLLFAVLKWKKHPIIYIAAGAVCGMIFQLQ